MSAAPRVTISRCEECAACQEFILTPSQAPECTSLRVKFPGEEPQSFGTERRVFRAIERWANYKFECLNGVSFVTVVWEAGTTVQPVLRQSFASKKRRPVHPRGGFMHLGCKCLGCSPRIPA